MTEHIVRAFSTELTSLANKIAAMGGLAEQQFADAMKAIETRDTSLGDQVSASDHEVDEMEREIEAQAVSMIARRQPMASDLREIIVAIKIASDLERIGDQAKNIARRVEPLHDERLESAIAGFYRMSKATMAQVKNVLDAYSTRNTQKAIAVWYADRDIDAIYNSLFRELLTYMMEDPRNIGPCTHLLFGAKSIERIGDHATNIAENVYFLVEGEPLLEQRLGGRETSLSADNA